MSIQVEVHNAVIVTCDECGHSWDVEDYDSPTLEMAKQRAEETESCPNCAEQK